MSRKSIFDLINSSFDLSQELTRILRLFESTKTVRTDRWGHLSLLEYMQREGFSTWKNRGHFIDATDFLSAFEYKILRQSALSVNLDLLLLIEIIYNFWHIAATQTHSLHVHTEQGKNFKLLKTIMDDCLAHYGYKGEYLCEKQQLIVIEDKPEATAVAEITQDVRFLRYNHFLLKGDLAAKKELLLAFGSDLEPKRATFEAVNKALTSDIFFMLNNLHLRHNNKAEGDKHYKAVVAKMDNATLENWYDELYQMILLAYLELDQVARGNRVATLKTLLNQN